MRPDQWWRARLANPKVTDLLALVTALVTAVLLVLAVLYWPRITTTTIDLSRSTQIQGCRSQSNAMVTAARTEFDVARAMRDTEATRLSLLIAEGLVDIAIGDTDHLRELIPAIEDARRAVATAEDEVVEATAVLRSEQDRHADATQLSITDLDAYLRACRDFAPNGD